MMQNFSFTCLNTNSFICEYKIKKLKKQNKIMMLEKGKQRA
jgi:hypothetical protein